MNYLMALFFVLFLSLQVDASQTLITNTTLYTSTGAGVLKNTDILFDTTKIISIGSSLTDHPKAKEASIIDGKNFHITAGLVSAYSHLGILEISAEASTRNDQTQFYGPGFSIAPAINHRSIVIDHNLSYGLTTALVSPNFNYKASEKALGKLFYGLSSIISLKNGPDKLIKQDVALFLNLKASEDSVATKFLLLEDAFKESQSFLKKSGIIASEFGFLKRDLEALQQVKKRKIPLFVFVNSEASIRRLITFAKKQNINVIILGGKEAYLVADQLSDADIPVIFEVLDNIPDGFSSLAATLDAAKILHQSGVVFSFMTYNSGAGTANPYLLRQLAGNAVANGLSKQAALEAITKHPATIIGAELIGQLKKGYKADLVLWDGDPLEITSHPKMIFIEGQKQNLNSRQKRLLERYKSKSKRPIQYR